MKNKLCSILLFIVISSEARPQSVNPCIALKLPLCRVKNDFAQEHGITQKAPEPVRSRVPEPSPIRTRVQEPTPSFSPTTLPKRSQSSFTREETL